MLFMVSIIQRLWVVLSLLRQNRVVVKLFPYRIRHGGHFLRYEENIVQHLTNSRGYSSNVSLNGKNGKDKMERLAYTSTSVY